MVKSADLTMGKMANPGTGLYISLKVRNLERLCLKLKGRTVIRKYEGGIPAVIDDLIHPKRWLAISWRGVTEKSTTTG